MMEKPYKDIKTLVDCLCKYETLGMCPSITMPRAIIENILEWIEYLEKNKKEPELKPCPFCGGEGGLRLIGLKDIYDIKCKKCGVWTRDCKTKKEAIDAWNRRE